MSFMGFIRFSSLLKYKSTIYKALLARWVLSCRSYVVSALTETVTGEHCDVVLNFTK